jgi:hypothetical protein
MTQLALFEQPLTSIPSNPQLLASLAQP